MCANKTHVEMIFLTAAFPYDQPPDMSPELGSNNVHLKHSAHENPALICAFCSSVSCRTRQTLPLVSLTPMGSISSGLPPSVPIVRELALLRILSRMESPDNIILLHTAHASCIQGTQLALRNCWHAARHRIGMVCGSRRSLTSSLIAVHNVCIKGDPYINPKP